MQQVQTRRGARWAIVRGMFSQPPAAVVRCHTDGQAKVERACRLWAFVYYYTFLLSWLPSSLRGKSSGMHSAQKPQSIHPGITTLLWPCVHDVGSGLLPRHIRVRHPGCRAH